MNQNGDELLLNSCKSLNGISSLVSDAIKSGVHTDQITKSLGINGTEITPLWKNLGIISANNVNNNTSNSSGENSTTSLNEMGKVSRAKFLSLEIKFVLVAFLVAKISMLILYFYRKTIGEICKTI